MANTIDFSKIRDPCICLVASDARAVSRAQRLTRGSARSARGETSPWAPSSSSPGSSRKSRYGPVVARARTSSTSVHPRCPLSSRRATVVASPSDPPDRRPPNTRVPPHAHQNEIVALAERLGATVNLSFSKDDPFDFCVAKTVNSPKYLLAREAACLEATPAWLRQRRGRVPPAGRPRRAGRVPPACSRGSASASPATGRMRAPRSSRASSPAAARTPQTWSRACARTWSPRTPPPRSTRTPRGGTACAS